MGRRFQECQCEASVRYKLNKRSNWSAIDRPIASMMVSIGNEKCAGAYFRALLTWCSRQFDEVTVTLVDTLKTHHHLATNAGMSVAEAHALGLEQGERWLATNLEALNAIAPRARLIRWDEWRAHDKFQPYLNRLEDLFHSEEGFRELILADIRRYAERRLGPALIAGRVDLDVLKWYPLEELAVYAIKGETPRLVTVYPGSPLNALRFIQDTRAPQPLKDRHYLYVDLKGADEIEASAGPAPAPTGAQTEADAMRDAVAALRDLPPELPRLWLHG